MPFLLHVLWNYSFFCLKEGKEKKKSNAGFPCLSFLVCLSSCITPPLLYPHPFSILLVLLLLPSLLMLGRPEAAPGGNNKTQKGVQRLLESEEMVLGCNIHRLSVCVCVCVCVWRRLSGLLPDASHPHSYHSLYSKRPVYFHSNFQLIFVVLSSKYCTRRTVSPTGLLLLTDLT